MDYPGRNSRQACQTQEAAHRLTLQEGWAGAGMPSGGESAGAYGSLPQQIQHGAVFTVDPQHAADLLHLREDVVELGVADHKGVIGQIALEGSYPGCGHFPQLGAGVLIPVAYGHMEAVVTGAVPVGPAVPHIQGLLQAATLVLSGEIQDGGGAPGYGCRRAGLEAVGGDGAGHGHLQMGVGVDEAGKDQAAGGVHHPVARELRGDAAYLLPLYEYVGNLQPSGGDEGAAFYHGTHISPGRRL